MLAYPNVSFERPLLQGAVLPPPRPGLPVGDPFAALMIADAAPAALGRNVYVRLTGEPAGERRSREQRLAQAVVASEDELRPAEVMALSLRACDGSFPLAALTAHNLLKGAAHPPPRTATASMPDPGELAAKLVELRPAGDKASLWYHAFVPLSVAAWTGDADEADAVLTKEYGLRFLGSLNGTGTAADSELQANGRCFARAARTILARRAETAAPAAAAGAPATAPGGAGSLAGEARLMLMPFEPVLVSADQGETPDLRADLERAMCIPGIHRGTPQIRVGRDGSFGVDCGLERNEPGDRAATTGRISGRVELGTGQPSFSGGSTQLQEFTLEVAGTLQSVTHTTSYRSVVRQTEKDRRGRASKVLGKMRYDHQRTTPRGEIHRYTAEVPFEMTLRYD